MKVWDIQICEVSRNQWLLAGSRFEIGQMERSDAKAPTNGHCKNREEDMVDGNPVRSV